jgi:kynurenine formamidase
LLRFARYDEQTKEETMTRPHHSHAVFLLIAMLCCIAATSSPARDQSGLVGAYRVIAEKTFVDLTHSFGPDTPVWSGFGQAKFSPAADPRTHEPYTIAKDGFRTTYYEMVGQYGTHVDPPAHFAENGITMDQIPLKQMILPLVVLDDTPYLGPDPNHAFSVADLKAWERKHGRVPKGAFAALRTDMYYILQHGHYQIEVMANLDKVPATGAVIVVTWPKVKDGLGFPARAFAILP